MLTGGASSSKDGCSSLERPGLDPLFFFRLGILGLQLSDIACFFACRFLALRVSGAPAVGVVWSCCLSIWGLKRFWCSSCRVQSVFRLSISSLNRFLDSSCLGVSGLFVCQLQASRESGAPAVGDCLFPCLSSSGLDGFWGTS